MILYDKQTDLSDPRTSLFACCFKNPDLPSVKPVLFFDILEPVSQIPSSNILYYSTGYCRIVHNNSDR